MEFPTPFAVHAETVRPEWIDYNGHMNVAYYVLVFDHATDALFEALGLGPTYRHANDLTLFAVESHILYTREVAQGDLLRVESRVLGGDGKRLHFGHEMFHAAEGWRAATIELMAVHVDLATRRTSAFPPERQQAIERAVAAHAALPAADWVGRHVSLTRHKR
ncbi:MAG TPA: thioesterase family protein [Aliidongia sp.]|uniref:thioesterase family protein n=1 Tax=Aliidongia sp. TaxID=1914230 RepID=UPI002DDD2663|nr:thioesterase family protein [Aliidongia sp.]HEV2676667.1 thioesterase family protein [Aliidongia sp.]